MKAFFLTLVALCIFSSAQALEKASYLEISPMVAFQSSDALRSSTLGALSMTYHHSRLIWFGVDAFLGQSAADEPNGLQVRDGKKLIGLNGAFYFNLPALLGVVDKKEEGLFADLYTSLGVGNYWLDREEAIYGFIGGGMLIHTPLSWLIFRFDLKGLFYVLENAQGGNFNSDMVLSLGPSLAF